VSRKDRRKKGADLRAQLNILPPVDLALGFEDFVTDIAYGGIWARPGLILPDRMILHAGPPHPFATPASASPVSLCGTGYGDDTPFHC
jgi:hypothetical protein